MWTSNIRAASRGLLRSPRIFLCANKYGWQLESTSMRLLAGFSTYRKSSPLRRPLQVRSEPRAFNFSSKSTGDEKVEGSVTIDPSSLLEEKEFHKLADEILDYIQEKVDALGEELDIEGFDTDHAEGVLTIRLGTSGTYVINKQTPNKQIWLSSPVSGPARFDWDGKSHGWVYRRTKSEMLSLLEKELHELFGASVSLAR